MSNKYPNIEAFLIPDAHNLIDELDIKTGIIEGKQGGGTDKQHAKGCHFVK
jgi:hypothetical protein